jgi:hypothetical protein
VNYPQTRDDKNLCFFGFEKRYLQALGESLQSINTSRNAAITMRRRRA